MAEIRCPECGQFSYWCEKSGVCGRKEEVES